MSELKRGVLLKKAQKFFEQFPDRYSTILKMKIGNIDTHWNVQRQKGQLQITEINSSKNIITIKEDLTVAGGKGGKKPFEYDPVQKPGTGTVAPGMERQKYSQQKGSPASIGAAAQSIRNSPTAQRYDQQSQATTPPPLPSSSRAAQMKMKSIRGTAPSDFEPEVIKRATQRLSDREFGDFYGFSKKSALQRQSTPPPNPARVAKAGMKPYGEGKKYRIVMEGDGDIRGIDQTSDVEQPEQSPEQLPEPEPQKSGEEKAISKLAGQTIKSADVQFDENSGKLTLTLAGTQHPAVLEWSRTGRVVFLWKGQKYTIKK